MIKLIIVALGFWLLWGYGWLPSYSFLQRAVAPFVEGMKTQTEDQVVLKSPSEGPIKREKRW